MSSGCVLRNAVTVADYGTGGAPVRHRSGWKNLGKIRAELMGSAAALHNALDRWADEYRRRGFDVEFSW